MTFLHIYELLITAGGRGFESLRSRHIFGWNSKGSKPQPQHYPFALSLRRSRLYHKSLPVRD